MEEILPTNNTIQDTAAKRRMFSWWDEFGRFGKIGLVLLSIFFLILFYFTLDANKYRATVHVIAGEGKVGINPTSEVLDFGDLSPGTSAVRRIDVQNKTPIPMFVMVMRLGAITDLMKQDKNFFTVKGHEGAKMEFSVYMPASAQIDKTFGGKVFIFKIPTWR